MKTSYIACVAGKSGGHIIPCLTYARTIKNPDQKIVFFSNNTPLDYAILKDQPDIAHHIPYALAASYSIRGFCKTVVQFVRTTYHAYKTLKKYRPTQIISTGGVISLPVFIAGWLLRIIPRTLFELNAVPGKAARACAPFASTIHVCFASALPYFSAHKTTLKPYPLKPEIVGAASRQQHAPGAQKTVLVLGGSQGSVSLNALIKTMITTHPDFSQKIRIIHQTGSNDQTDWPQWYAQHHINAQVFDFCTDLSPHYQQAAIVIARAGAGTLFEIVAFQKKCIIIPLEIRQTLHQRDNALAIAKEYPHLCTVLREKELMHNHNLLCKTITTLLF